MKTGILLRPYSESSFWVIHRIEKGSMADVFGIVPSCLLYAVNFECALSTVDAPRPLITSAKKGGNELYLLYFIPLKLLLFLLMIILKAFSME
mmetsp:Transcript_16814/g.21841  ORF Transcript_16814/g.21841 Transcript_16814/m.21841 type:complete len:93 (-) Transcript_16814:264-542(-)